MSSEAEARKAAEEAARFIEWDGTYPLAEALDDYKTAIERRVLAQQPTRVHLAHDERCETCNDVAAWMAKISRERTARQSQETSG